MKAPTIIYTGGLTPDLALHTDPASPYFGWLCARHPDGSWVTVVELRRYVKVASSPAFAVPPDQIEFERALRDRYPIADLQKTARGEYPTSAVQWAWIGWQLATTPKHCVFCGSTHVKGPCPDAAFAVYKCKQCEAEHQLPLDCAGLMGDGSTRCACDAPDTEWERIK